MSRYENTPLPPSALLYQISGNSDPAIFYDSVDHLTDNTLKNLKDSGVTLKPDSRVLDFGCGVGKVLIGLHERNPNFRLYGCDLEENLIAWVKQNLDFVDCYSNRLSPPLRYEDSSFDFINAISVFTHLTLFSQFQWAWELFRILKPGGVLHMTTHGAQFFGLFSLVMQTRKVHRLDITSFGADSLMMEIEQYIDSPEYSPKVGLEAQGQLEVAVAHTPQAVNTIFGAFQLQRHFPETAIGNGHDVYVLTKPLDAASIISAESSVEGAVDDDAGLSFTFNYNGQSYFKVFATSVDPGVFIASVSCSVTLMLDGEHMGTQTLSVSKGARFFGSSHYSQVMIALPLGRRGRLTVRIFPNVSNPSYLTRIKWIAAHIY